MTDMFCRRRSVTFGFMLVLLVKVLRTHAAAQAGCLTFTDDPLSVGTPVKAVHVTELRTCVDALRSTVSQQTGGWTDSLVPTSTSIKAIHITQLRSAIASLYPAFGYSAPSYTDASLVAGVTEIKRLHITELRAALRVLAPNITPTLTLPGDRLQLEGTTTSLQLQGTDPEGVVLTYFANGLPAGLSLNQSSGLVSGTLASGSAGTYSVGISVSDGNSSASQIFEWRVVSAATTVIYDKFMQANGQSFPDHILDMAPTGLHWSWLRGTRVPFVANETARVDGSPQSEAWTVDVALADVTLAVDVKSSDATPYGGLVFRASDANNYLFLRYQGPYLYRRVNGEYQTLASASQAFNAGELHRLKVRAEGSQIDVYSDGVLMFSTSETFNQTATRHGLLWDPTEDLTLWFDNFELHSNQTITSIPTYECQSAVSPGSMTVNSENNTYHLSVWAAPGCDWSFNSSSSFITTGRYYDGVAFSIENNTTGQQRTGVLDIAGHSISVTQLAAPPPAPNGPCTPTITPTTFAVSSDGGNGEVIVTAPGGCTWTIQNIPAFVHVTSDAAGNGSGLVSFTTDASTSEMPRTGTFTIGGLTVAVFQGATSPCDFSLSITPGASNAGSLGLDLPEWCSWSVTPQTVGISASPSSGTGDASISLALDPALIAPQSTGPLSLLSSSQQVVLPSANQSQQVCKVIFDPCGIWDGNRCFNLPILVCAGPTFPTPPPVVPARVLITQADVILDRIDVRVDGASGTPTLTLKLIGDNNEKVLDSFAAAPGKTYVLTFKTNELVEDHYNRLEATWAGQVTHRDLAFQALGLVRHTQYNVPLETKCSDVSVTAHRETGFDNSPGSANACSYPVTIFHRKDFVKQTLLNGHGVSGDPAGDFANDGVLTHPFSCSNTDNGNAELTGVNAMFRAVSTLVGAFEDRPLTTTTLAARVRDAAHPDWLFLKDDRVLIVGFGSKTGTVKYVGDKCGSGCNDDPNHHLDNFSFNGACSGNSVGDLGVGQSCVTGGEQRGSCLTSILLR